VSWVKATVRFLHAWRHPDGIAREVEAELRFHIEMRTAANIESGMRPNEAQRAARQSFGDFERVKTECCEISRSLSFDPMPVKMGLHIALAAFAGVLALWAVNVPHHSFFGVFRQLVAITILTCLFIFVRRARSRRRLATDHMSDISIAERERPRKNEFFISDAREQRHVNIAAHDEQGRTPVERMFKSE
jgi:uncharacterized membrane protein YedE/YeeE